VRGLLYGLHKGKALCSLTDFKANVEQDWSARKLVGNGRGYDIL